VVRTGRPWFPGTRGEKVRAYIFLILGGEPLLPAQGAKEEKRGNDGALKSKGVVHLATWRERKNQKNSSA